MKNEDQLIGRKRKSMKTRFARPDIQFYDAHWIELYRLICALYLMA